MATAGNRKIATARPAVAKKSTDKIVVRQTATPLIDFPGEMDTIIEGCYTIRVSADADAQVEVAINNGDWQACRPAVGYWWFDWHTPDVSIVKITARARHNNGRWETSASRLCQVVSRN